MRSRPPSKATPPISCRPLTPNDLSSPAAIDSSPGAVGAKILNRGEREANGEGEGEGDGDSGIVAQLTMSASSCRAVLANGSACPDKWAEYFVPVSARVAKLITRETARQL